MRFAGVGIMRTGIALALFTITIVRTVIANRIREIASEAIEAEYRPSASTRRGAAPPAPLLGLRPRLAARRLALPSARHSQDSKGRSVADTLGFSMVTFPPIAFREMGDVAQRADDLGWDRMYTSESLTDTLTIDMYLAARTQRLVIASGVALIYYRHPLITAQAATTISDVSGGRFILGLGLGHQPRNHAMGVGFGKPLAGMREYVRTLRGLISGDNVYPGLPLQTYEGVPLGIKRPQHRLPIAIAAVGPKMIELAGEVADGIQLSLAPISRLRAVRTGIARGAARAGRDPADIEVKLAIHLLLSNDLELAREKARRVLTYWAGLPSYNASIAAAGFKIEAALIRQAFLAGDQDAMCAAMSDAFLDEFAVLGPAGRCRDRIAALRDAGVDVPIMQIDPVEPGESFADAMLRTLQALAPR